MKICGVIAEYNPFHAGHEYHLKKAREVSGADFCVAVMSGYFVQRGEPAIFDPYMRAEAALRHGADAVFMMPVRYSTASAGEFALGGISILDNLGCDCISYGVEREDKTDERLNSATDIKGTEDSEGTSNRVFLKPNNILAAEYKKAIAETGSCMEVVEINRIGHGYNDDSFEGDYPSATAIRKNILNHAHGYAVDPDDTIPVLEATIRRLIHDGADLEQFLDVNRELADRIKKCEFDAKSFEELVLSLKTRRYTYTRIARCLMHILLDVRKDADTSVYAHLIGFRRDAGELLSELKRRSKLEIISKPADFKDVLSRDAYAAEVYDMLKSEKPKGSTGFYSTKRIIV